MSGPRLIEFLFHKVDRRGLYLGDVTQYVTSGSISMDQDRDVKMQGRFVLKEAGVIDYLAEYLMPIIRVTEDGVMTEYQVGIFRLGWPKTAHSPMLSTGDVAAYDLSIHLLEDVFATPYTVPAGANPVAAAKAVAQSVGYLDGDGEFVPMFENFNFPTVSTWLQVDMSWEVGTPKMRAVVALLDAANCWSPWMEGVWLTSRVRQSLAEMTVAVAYRTDATSIVLPDGVQVQMDATRFANKVIVRVENPDLRRQNLLSNPDFEEPFTSIWEPGASGTIGQQAEVEGENYVYHGLYSVKWTPGVQNGGLYHLPDIAVVPGRAYVFTFRLKGTNADTFEARWEDGAGWTSMGAAVAIGSNGYVLRELEFTPDEAIVKTIEIRNTTATPHEFWVDSCFVAERDEPAPIYATYTNSNPDSPTSTVSLGRTICKMMDAKSIQTQADADAYARLMCEEAASIYKKASLPTGLDPGRKIHEVYELDVYRSDEELLIGKWWCTGWQMPLSVGGVMVHEMARVEAI